MSQVPAIAAGGATGALLWYWVSNGVLMVFRGISGFGKMGKMHSSSLLDRSMDLPLVIEFFDEPAKIATILAHLNTRIEPGHMVGWSAVLHG